MAATDDEEDDYMSDAFLNIEWVPIARFTMCSDILYIIIYYNEKGIYNYILTPVKGFDSF